MNTALLIFGCLILGVLLLASLSSLNRLNTLRNEQNKPRPPYTGGGFEMP